VKVIVGGETFDYDGSKQPMSEALWIEHVYKRRYAEWQADLEAGSAKAFCMLACLIWRRDGRDVGTAYDDLIDGKTDFDLQEMIRSMSESAEERAAAEADPTGPPDPAGTPGIATDTPGSSPRGSGSGRGKSGSSKSGTSKP
jgi:hypothetical protein